jgi:hypothetical protein
LVLLLLPLLLLLLLLLLWPPSVLSSAVRVFAGSLGFLPAYGESFAHLLLVVVVLLLRP